MRMALLTMAMLVAMDSDLQALLWVAILAAPAVALGFVGFLLKPAAPRRRVPGRGAHGTGKPTEGNRWKGLHRVLQKPGRHAPARGQRLRGVSRQAQLEEPTVSVGLRDVARWFDVPERLLRPASAAAPWCTDHQPFRDGIRIRCRTCKLDLDRPEDQPDIGRNGFRSWA